VNKKLSNQSFAKRLIIGGAIGLAVSIAATLPILLSVYNEAAHCPMATSCGYNPKPVSTVLNIISGLAFVSLAALMSGFIVVIVAQYNNYRRQAAATRVNHAAAVRRLAIRTIAYLAAFFISTSAVIILVSTIVETLLAHKTIVQRTHILVLVLLPVYFLVGGFAVYAMHNYLRRKLK